MDVIIRYEAIPNLQSRCANPPCNLGIASSYLLAMTIFFNVIIFFSRLTLVVTRNYLDMVGCHAELVSAPQC
jgi:hypothetical protein